MMGHQSRQMAMIFVDIESLIPETHLLRKIERMVSFDFIYDLLAPYYPATGRPSVDPVSMFKMLLIGYLYGIKSEQTPPCLPVTRSHYKNFRGNRKSCEAAVHIPLHSFRLSRYSGKAGVHLFDDRPIQPALFSHIQKNRAGFFVRHSSFVRTIFGQGLINIHASHDTLLRI